MNGVLQSLAAEVGTSDRTLRRALNAGAIRGARPSAYKVDISLAERAYVRRYWPLLAALRAGLRLEHSVEAAVLFGSMARGDADETSDVDLLVWLRPGASRSAIGRRLSQRVGRHVQIIDAADAARNASLLRAILHEGRPLVDRTGRWEQLARRRGRIVRAARDERKKTSERAGEAIRYFTEVGT